MDAKVELFKEKINEIKKETEAYGDIKIVAATKYMSIEDTKKIAEAGITDLGENRTEMFLEKYEALKGMDIKWHFFGVVQSRKVRDVANKISCLHSLDKLSTAMELDKRLEETLDCYVQINISEEPNKEGIPATRVKPFIKSLSKCSKIRIIGLMCIAKHTYDEEIINRSFAKMQKLKAEVEALNLDYAPCHELSMGMSNDYKIALKYGATCLRLGRVFLS